jgi:hypothetical protein
MIVTAKQYECLRQEMWKSASPRLWSLLTYPFEDVTPPRKITKQWQREALKELHTIARFEMPDRLLLDDVEETKA